MRTLLILLSLVPSLLNGLTLDFTQDQNADPDGVAGANDLGVTSKTLPAIADGNGGDLDLTITSSGGNINAANIGLGVVGLTGGRLDAGETLSFSFDRDVIVTGYTNDEFDAAEDSTHATPAEGPSTETTASVTGLCLPLLAGETFVLSTITGDGIRIATLKIDLATVLFRDTFARTGQPSDDLDADNLGMSGGLAPLGYFEGNDTAVGLSNIEGGRLHLADGSNSSQIHLEHSFDEAAIVTEGGFAVTFNLASNDGSADDTDRFIGLGVGLSTTELATYGADFSATAVLPGIRGAPGGTTHGSGISDWYFGFTRNGVNGEENTLLVEIYQNGSLTNSYATFDSGNPINIGDRGKICVRFACDSFASGTQVVPSISWGAETIGSSEDNSFTWQNTDANHIGITARQNSEGWSVEGLSISAVEPNIVTEAVDDFFEVAQNAPATPLDVLTNDLGFAVASGLATVSDPPNGSANINGDQIDYTPDSSYVGPDSFTYELNNGSSALVTIEVLSPSRDDFFQVLQNSAASPLAIGDNDLSVAALSTVSDPPNGSAAIEADQINYTPDPSHLGADSFTYTRTDGSSATVSLDVRQHPNFVLIYTDDQGWTSLEIEMDKNNPESKSDYYISPNIATLAEEGMRFSRGYSPAPNCSPSRYGILTGKTCVRLGLTDIVGRNFSPAPNTSNLLVSPGKLVNEIQTSETTLPELLKSAGVGYTTAHFGKWHLNGGGPASHGFDTSDGATSNGTGNQGPASTPVADPKLAYSITDRAMTWLEDESDAGNPVFLQLSHYAVHSEIQFSAASRALYDGVPLGTDHFDPSYGAMLTDMDASVGQLLQRIDELGLRHSTYVIYQADNGSPLELSASSPLRGYKPEIWEGGIRVPTLMRGPGINPDTQMDTPMMGIDLFPTIWEYAGQPATSLPPNIDGASLVPAIAEASAGNADPAIQRPGEIVAYTPHYVVNATKDQRPRAVIVDGDYKLVVQFEQGTIELYNLEQRIEEDTDLAGIDIGKRWQLWVRLRDYMKETGALYALPDPDNFGPADGIDDGDADNDDLPDAWEMREMLSIAFNGSADTDGDGRTDAQELADGTDPLLPAALTISSIERVNSNTLALGWTSTPGLYRIETSDDLDDWQLIDEIITDTASTLVEVTFDSDDPQRFYRVSR
jgi:arylsulfatase A-like enzyme